MNIVKRILKWIKISVLVLIATALLSTTVLSLYIQTEHGKNIIRLEILKKVNPVVKGFNLGKIDGTFFTRLSLHNVQIDDSQGRKTVFIKTISLTYDLLALINNKIHIKSIVIEQPEIYVICDTDKTCNLQQLTDTSRTEEDGESQKDTNTLSDYTIDVDNIAINSGYANINIPETKSEFSDISLQSSMQLIKSKPIIHIDKFLAKVLGHVVSHKNTRRFPYSAKVSLSGSYNQLEKSLNINGLVKGKLPTGKTAQLSILSKGSMNKLTNNISMKLDSKNYLELKGAIGIPHKNNILSPYADVDITIPRFDLKDFIQTDIKAAAKITALVKGSGMPLEKGSEYSVKANLSKGYYEEYLIDTLLIDASVKDEKWVLNNGKLQAYNSQFLIDGNGTKTSAKGSLSLSVPSLNKLPLGIKSLLRGTIKLKSTYDLSFNNNPAQTDLVIQNLDTDISSKYLQYNDTKLKAFSLALNTRNIDINQLKQKNIKDITAAVTIKSQSIMSHALPRELVITDTALHIKLADKKLRTKLKFLENNNVTTLTATGFIDLSQQFFVDERENINIKLSIPERSALPYLKPAGTETAYSAPIFSLEAEVQGRLHNPNIEISFLSKDMSFKNISDIKSQLQINLKNKAVTLRSKIFTRNTELVAVTASSLLPLGKIINQKIDITRLPLELSMQSNSVPLTIFNDFHSDIFIVDGTASSELVVHKKGRKLRASGKIDLRAPNINNKEIGDTSIYLNAKVENKQSHATLSIDNESFEQVKINTEIKQNILKSPYFKNAFIHTDMVVQQFDLEQLSDIIPDFPPIRTKLNLTADIRGHLNKPENMAAQIKMNLDNILFKNAPLGTVDVSARTHKKRIAAKLDYNQIKGGTISLKAAIPISIIKSNKSLVDFDDYDVNVKINNLNLSILNNFKQTTPIEEIEGILNGHLTAKGGIKNPQLSSNLSAEIPKLHLQGTTPFYDISLISHITENYAEIKKLHAQSRGKIKISAKTDLPGSFTPLLSKELEIAPLPFSLSLNAQSFNLSTDTIKDVTMDGPLSVKGTWNMEKVTAEIIGKETVITVPEITKGKQMHLKDTPPDIVFVESVENLDYLDKLTMQVDNNHNQLPLHVDLTLKTTPLFIRGKEVDAAVHTDLRILTDKEKIPRITGSIKIPHGWVKIMGYKYNVDLAQLNFNGEYEPDPSINFKLSHQFPQATAIISLKGTPKHPELTLSSAPSNLDRTQIIALILTGNVSYSTEGNSDQSSVVTQAISNAVFGQFSRQIAPKLGIDVLKASLGSKETTTGDKQLQFNLELGKYLTPRMYIGFRRVVGSLENQNSNEGIFEYRFTSHWFLTGVFGDAGAGGVDIFWVYRY